jgi:hypothetical protein
MVASRYEEDLRDLAISLCPDLERVLHHDSAISRSTWSPSGETGKSLELLTLCGLVRAFRDKGAAVEFPGVYFANPDLFFLRNTLPRHHDAQAGHGSAHFKEIGLKDRFIAALTPKAVVRLLDGSDLMILREGYPVHLIDWISRGSPEYLDRPDIILAHGSISMNSSHSDELEFSLIDGKERRRGRLRIKNDISIPIVSYDTEGDDQLRVGLFVECSVGKARQAATNQLDRYLELFSSKKAPISVLVNGRGKTYGDYNIEIAVSPTQPIGDIEGKLLQGLNMSLDLLSSSKGT